MTCCGKIKKGITKTKNIVKGYGNLIRGRKYEFTDGRIRACWDCEKKYWIKKTLWCSLCKCFIPAKARVKEEECPLGKWKGI